jgi:hypothetical protein
MAKQVLGSALSREVQCEVLRRFVHRYTGEHVPAWAKQPRPDGRAYQPHFPTDADWLRCTKFWVRPDGELDGRYNRCESNWGA